MKCVKIFAATYTSRTTGNESRKAVALFDNGEELLFAKPVDEITELLKTRTKDEVVVVTGSYGRYAAFSVFTDKEDLA